MINSVVKPSTQGQAALNRFKINYELNGKEVSRKELIRFLAENYYEVKDWLIEGLGWVTHADYEKAERAVNNAARAAKRGTETLWAIKGNPKIKATRMREEQQ